MLTDVKDLIEIDFKTINPRILNYINHELDKCRANGISIYMPKRRSIAHSGGDYCAGYLEVDHPSGRPMFAVACGRSIRNWLLIFVHESCHLDQWLEQVPFWEVYVNGESTLDVMDQWLNLKVDLNSRELKAVFDNVIEIEADCERRSVEKIKQWDLPINIDSYIRKSNAYIWSYRLMQETRNWNHTAAYGHGPVWRAMPKYFDQTYDVLPDKIRNTFYKHIEHFSRI